MSQILQGLPTETESFSQLLPTRGSIYEFFPDIELPSTEDLRRQDALLNWVENDSLNHSRNFINHTSFLETDYTKDYLLSEDLSTEEKPVTFFFTSSALVSEENDENTEDFSSLLDSHLQKYMDKEINDSIALPASFQEAPKSRKRSANTNKKSTIATKKRGKKERRGRKKQKEKQEENVKVEQNQKKENIKIKHDQENQNAEVKQEEPEDCIDVETISDEIPVLQAPDVESLLEQFEASEKQEVLSIPCNEVEIKKDSISCTNSIKTQQVRKKEDQSNIPKKFPRTCIPQQKSPSKEVIDRIKASTQKVKYISIIPAIPNNKHLKNCETRKTIETCNKKIKPYELKERRFKAKNLNKVSIIQDHDYCNPILPTVGENLRNRLSCLKSNKNEMISKSFNKTKEHDSNSKKQFHHSTTLEESSCSTGPKLTKTNVLDKTAKQTASTLTNIKTDKINDTAFENKCKSYQGTILKQCQETNSLLIKNVNAQNESSKAKSLSEMKIRSALAASIIESRNNMQGKIQMVSVLKKPPNISQSSLLKSNSNENNVASIPSVDKYLERVQDLIVQSTPESPSHEEEKKPRKKLNLAEYRNRNLSSNNKTSCPTQRTWKYVHHTFTTTEPIKDNLNNPVWSETEILMEESDIEAAKNKAKIQTRSIEIQTYETVFEFSKSLISERSEEVIAKENKEIIAKGSKEVITEESEKRKENDIRIEDKNEKSPNNKHNLSSSSSKSSLQSKTKWKRNRSRSRSRTRIGKRNRTRSRSRSRSTIIIDTDDSKSKSSSRSRSTSSNRSKSTSRSRSRSRNRSRNSSRSRSKIRTRTRIGTRTKYETRSKRIRTRTRSRSRSRSRSSSNSRSRSHRYSYTRRRRLSYRRSSVSSSSSWSSQSRLYETSNSRSSSRSRTSSRYNSSSRSYDSDRYYREMNEEDVEQRKILYVGHLDENVTKADLNHRFKDFGPIKNISLHFNKNGNNYGFITFECRDDAYDAKERGNKDPSLPKYELSFGGRRTFCKDRYTDLDNVSNSPPIHKLPQTDEQSFDYLLKTAKERIKKKV